METVASPTSLKQTHTPNSSPKPAKKSFVASLRSPSFKEDTYFISHLKNSERKALKELKDKLTATHGANSMWGIPLLGTADDRADVILLKFLRARDFRVQDALNMLIFINVSWYFSLLYSVISLFLTQLTKSKFVISKEGNAAETLYKSETPSTAAVSGDYLAPRHPNFKSNWSPPSSLTSHYISHPLLNSESKNPSPISSHSRCTTKRFHRLVQATSSPLADSR
ncbi:hypothetical protein SASPL_152573 [Salvia splendens]|uniref:CRAL/TRIO N-terminal domain-containing protein n=1 Tax=Salvia splendens TaxID=180675 RepID=A0A8X8Z0H4_SALSN|nr:hypothetical protein SASPL_152573 [Salvia splendens]